MFRLKNDENRVSYIEFLFRKWYSVPFRAFNILVSGEQLRLIISTS